MRNAGIASLAGVGLASLLMDASIAQYSIDNSYSFSSFSHTDHYREERLVLPQTASLAEKLTLTGTICGGCLASGYGIYRSIRKLDSKEVRKVSRRFISSFRS